MKELRHKFYKEVLKYVCKDPDVDYGLCYAIGRVAWRMYLVDGVIPRRQYFILSNIKELEELYSLRPAGVETGGFWFPLTKKGWEKRIALLEKAIELSKP